MNILRQVALLSTLGYVRNVLSGRPLRALTLRVARINKAITRRTPFHTVVWPQTQRITPSAPIRTYDAADVFELLDRHHQELKLDHLIET